MSEERASVTVRIAGEPRKVEFPMPAQPVRPAAMLPVFRLFSNLMVEAAEARAAAEGVAVSCTKGCTACCHHLVPIREMEARRLAALVESMPEPRRSATRARFAEAGAKLAETGMRTRLDGRGELDPAGRIGLKLDYFDLWIACPFLEEESCGIYEERPMICREHLTTTPAEWCAAPRAGTLKALPMTRADSAAAKLEAREGGPEWVPLIDLLTWTAKRPEDPAAREDPRRIMERFLRELAG